MSSAQYQRLPLHDPALASPPASPGWRVSGKDLRLRPSHFRHAAFLIAAAILSLSLLAFYHLRQDPYLSESQQLDIRPTPDAPLLNSSHNHIPHHAHIPHPPSPPPPLQPVPSSALSASNTTINFSLIMFSQDSAAEGAVLIKSILMYSSSPLAFHIICDQAAQEYLEHRLNLVSHPQHPISVRFYRIPHDVMLARIQREGALHSDHSAGVPGLMKLFIHEILPDDVDRAIFVDTDAFFISDPAQLWARFNALKPGVAVSMPSHPEQDAPQWHNANRICSCIMLLDLARLRDLRLMDSHYYRQDADASRRVPALAPPAFQAMYGEPVPDGDTGRLKYDDVKLGDQGYWWAIVNHRPDIFEHLSYDWEVSSCLMDMYYTGLGEDDMDDAASAYFQIHTDGTPEQGRAVLPKMLHFNCLDGVDRYYDWPGWSEPGNDLARRWLPAVRYHVGYKWLWLNHPASEHALTVETLHDVKFADERYAASGAGH